MQIFSFEPECLVRLPLQGQYRMEILLQCQNLSLDRLVRDNTKQGRDTVVS